MAHVSHKLKNAFEGALAGGGDPATSPLYVFGPFLKLIVAAGVARVTFGVSVWMAVLTIAIVSATYRLVMRWVTDGSGGSGLSEEEFGSWAAKVNAAITFVEYTLTFLVSMAAMVTFIADRVPILNEEIFGIQYRAFVAIALSLLTGWIVNRGPKTAARAFGPATAGVLLLLWAMVIAALVRYGFNIPSFNLQAFTGEYFHFTLGGYVRILAVMTGIEVFANLVAAYDGTGEQKSRKAFNSLLIIMGTTAATMIIVGPAIFDLSDPANEHVSVFTQTMDLLLPSPLPLFGTLIGIAVLMSASAASAQGLQNLALGLKERGYIPPTLGQQNQFEVADKPVWIQVGIVVFCFLFFGTSEETYLALYAAGVFILLSMTAWAVTRRLLREIGASFSLGQVGLIAGTSIAALLTTLATILIFEERFLEGAWTYFVFIPLLYWAFTYFRSRLGTPSAEQDYLGLLNAAQLGGFGFGQAPASQEMIENGETPEIPITWDPEPKEHSRWREHEIALKKILLPLDGSHQAALALPMGRRIARKTGAEIVLLSSVKDHTPALKAVYEKTETERSAYLAEVRAELEAEGLNVSCYVRPGFIADATEKLVDELAIDLVVITPRGKSGSMNWSRGGASYKLVRQLDVPILLVQNDEGPVEDLTLDRILVSLDGSIFSEEVLPYARFFGETFGSELVLLSVPAVPDSRHYRAAGDLVEKLREEAEYKMQNFLSAVADSLRERDLRVRTIVTGSMPEHTIISVGVEEAIDLTMLTSQGRGGLDLLLTGSIAMHVVEYSTKPVFIFPIRKMVAAEKEDSRAGAAETV
jgi:nucleotide-binding universal stress UspA family protein